MDSQNRGQSQIEFFKETIKNELLQIKDDIGNVRYNLYVNMVDTCDDLDELKEMAELEMQIQAIKYYSNSIKNKLNEQEVDIKDIRKACENNYNNEEDAVAEDEETSATNISDEDITMMALILQQRLANEPLEERESLSEDDEDIPESDYVELLGDDDDYDDSDEYIDDSDEYGDYFGDGEEDYAEDIEDTEESSDNDEDAEDEYGDYFGDDDNTYEEDDTDSDEEEDTYGDYYGYDVEDSDEDSTDSEDYEEDEDDYSDYFVEDEEADIEVDNTDEDEDNTDEEDDYSDYFVDEPDEVEADEEDETDSDEEDDYSAYFSEDGEDEDDYSDYFGDDEEAEVFEESDETDTEYDSLLGIDEDNYYREEEEEANDEVDTDYGDILSFGNDDESDEEDDVDIDEDSSDADYGDLLSFGNDDEDEEESDEEDETDNSVDYDDLFSFDDDEDEDEDTDTSSDSDYDDLFNFGNDDDEEEEKPKKSDNRQDSSDSTENSREANTGEHVTFKNGEHAAETQAAFKTIGKTVNAAKTTGEKGIKAVKKKVSEVTNPIDTELKKEILNIVPVNSNRIKLRRYELTDIELFTKYMSDSSIYKYLRCDRMDNKEAVTRYINQLVKYYDTAYFTRFAIADMISNKLLGVISVYVKPDNSVELGYWLGAENVGKGYMLEAIQLLIKALKTVDKIPYIRAKILKDNIRSIKLVKRAGFIYRGKYTYNNEDIVVYQYNIER